MRVFTCDSCGQLIFFENDLCLSCGSPLGYVHERRDLIALVETGSALVGYGDPQRTWRRCATSELTDCNWLVTPESGGLCESCVLTRTRPRDDDVEGLGEFLGAELAKRRLVFQLAELGLPLSTRDEAAGTGVAFDLLSSVESKVVTGHDNGVITLDLAEADSEHREHLRLQFSEPYRTVLGHFRHEIGHYYWPLLVSRPEVVDACRNLFGDDRADYAEAIRRHYEDSHRSDTSWQTEYISRYATMHPFEDWAETFAHYLHILDTLQTAESFGLGTHAIPTLRPVTDQGQSQATRPYGSTTFEQVIDLWLELSCALNQVNRSMGHKDLYPFVLSPTVLGKLAFVDRLVTERSAAPERHAAASPMISPLRAGRSGAPQQFLGVRQGA